MRMGKPYDLVFTTKIVAVLTFLFTGRKKSVFLYTFALKESFFDRGKRKQNIVIRSFLNRYLILIKQK